MIGGATPWVKVTALERNHRFSIYFGS